MSTIHAVRRRARSTCPNAAVRVVALAALLAALCAPGSAARAATGLTLPTATYYDKSGDSKSAPDLTKLVVTNTAPGQLRFNVSVATAKTLVGSTLIVLLNTDLKRATGDTLGNDFGIVALQQGIRFASFDGDASAQVTPSRSMDPRLKNGVLSFTLTLADVGNPTTFALSVAGVRGNDVDGLLAPDGSPYLYPAKPEIQRVWMPLLSFTPKAGTIYRPGKIGFMLADGSPEAKIDISLELRVAGRVLKPLPGGKAWSIPGSLKGKSGVLKVTFSSGGVSFASQSFPLLKIE